jgi:hypothetical protein
LRFRDKTRLDFRDGLCLTRETPKFSDNRGLSGVDLGVEWVIVMGRAAFEEVWDRVRFGDTSIVFFFRL